MRYRFLTLDVFTDRPFAGNPLAVFPDARGLDEAAMLAIAREFGFSETTFVVPSTRVDAVRRVRIFTPTGELPFAGHPTVGTAIALVDEGYVPVEAGTPRLVLDLAAGPTTVEIAGERGSLRVTFTAPQPPTRGLETSSELVAAALGLPASAIDARTHLPVDVGTGLDFVLVRLADLEALGRAAPDRDAWTRLPSPAAAHGIMLYVPEGQPRTCRARMFGPEVGVAEDPATGSAAAALAGLLAMLEPAAAGTFRWTVHQGVEMGRPSRIDVVADKDGGVVTAVRVTGRAVKITDGWLEITGA